MSSKPVPDIWRIEVSVPEQALAAFEDALTNFADTVSWFMSDPVNQDVGEGGIWFLEGFSRTPVDRTALEAAFNVIAAVIGVDSPDIRIDRVPNMDWVTETLRQFPPLSIGRYFIHGSHYEGPLPASRISLQIDAGTAFGSGEHATTSGCLAALDWLAKFKNIRNPLDLGCGSGILALAISKTWPVDVLATDIDKQSVKVAHYNASLNGEKNTVRTLVSDGYRHHEIMRRAPYDLIVANILARPLCYLAVDLNRHLRPGGTVILSGLYDKQERWVLAAHRRQDLYMKRRIVVSNWHTLVLEKRAA